MKGINIAEQCKVVPLLHPVSGSTVTDIINLENYQHASILVVQGIGASSIDIVVKGSDDNASTTTSAIAFQYYQETTSGLDELSARTSAGTAGFAMTSGNNQFSVIEVDASELPSGQSFLVVDMESSENLVGVTAVLSGSRYAQTEAPTVLS